MTENPPAGFDSNRRRETSPDAKCMTKKNIRPRYWPDIYKSSFNFIRKLKLHEETIPSNQQTRELIRLRLFDKISLGLDIGTSFLLVGHKQQNSLQLP